MKPTATPVYVFDTMLPPVFVSIVRMKLCVREKMKNIMVVLDFVSEDKLSSEDSIIENTFCFKKNFDERYRTIQNSLTRFSETLQRYSFFLLEKLLCVYKKKERKFRGRSY